MNSKSQLILISSQLYNAYTARQGIIIIEIMEERTPKAPHILLRAAHLRQSKEQFSLHIYVRTLATLAAVGYNLFLLSNW